MKLSNYYDKYRRFIVYGMEEVVSERVFASLVLFDSNYGTKKVKLHNKAGEYQMSVYAPQETLKKDFPGVVTDAWLTIIPE